MQICHINYNNLKTPGDKTKGTDIIVNSIQVLICCQKNEIVMCVKKGKIFLYQLIWRAALIAQ